MQSVFPLSRRSKAVGVFCALLVLAVALAVVFASKSPRENSLADASITREAADSSGASCCDKPPSRAGYLKAFVQDSSPQKTVPAQ